MFSIRILEPADSSTALGEIAVDEFRERFQLGLGFWGPADYLASWRRALDFLASRDDAVSCLVSSITEPETSNFIFCWPLYRVGDDVLVQNAVIFLDELATPFDPARPWLSVQPYASHDEDGNRISEWRTDISQVRQFLDRLDRVFPG